MEGSSRVINRASGTLESWEECAPPDKGHLAYLTFFWLGAGFLFPWNAFITGIDYFASLYPESHVDYVFSVSYMLPNMLLLALLMMFGHHYSSRKRVLVGFVSFLCLLIMVPVLDLLTIHSGRGTSLSLFVTVAAVALSGSTDAVIQGSLFGMAGGLPEHFTQALVGGSSASGVIISIARIATKVVLPDTGVGLRLSAAVYFGLSSIFLLLCVLGCEYLHKLPIMQFYEQKKDQSESLLGVDRSPASDHTKAPPLDRSVESSLQPVNVPPGKWRWPFASKFFSVEGRALALENKGGADYWKVFLKVWPCATTLWLVYIVTLSIFPGFISESVQSQWLGDWFPVLLFFTFNLGDFFGKMAPTALQTPSMPLIVAGCCTRFLLYPLFALALFGPPILRSEAPVFVLTAVLGFSNGVFTGWLMMMAPARVKVEEAEASGNIMVFALVSGLFCGSCVGWLWLLF